ncbi:Protein of unknown function [Pseudidiomarina donghaiensis]|nr:Protein of unknown function [Pseudidiomarina donghaiensis]
MRFLNPAQWKKWAPKLVGLFLFDLVWFSAVAGRAEWLWATAILVAAQIFVALRSGPFSWRVYGLFVVLGMGLEASVVGLGILRFDGGFLPWWLIMLWLGFVAMLMNTLADLAGRPVWAALLGVASGPLTYAIGIRLGAAELLEKEWLLWVIYAALWAVYMVIFAYVMPRLAVTEKN